MEATFPTIWVPKYLKNRLAKSASALVNSGGLAGRSHAMVNAPTIRLESGGLDLTGLIAYYKMEQSAGDDAPDSSGAGLTLTDNNDCGSGTGKIGNAATFDGGSEYFSRTDDANFSMGTSVEWTIHFWFKTSNVGLSPAPVLVAKATSFAAAANFEYGVLLNANKAQLLVSDGSANDNVGHATSFSVDTWYFIAARLWDNAGTVNCDLNVNNGTPAEDTSSRWVFDGTHPFLIGGGIASRYMPGSIDSVGIWKRKLSNDELTILYAAGAGFDPV